jgi:anti-sigma factor RsiW
MLLMSERTVLVDPILEKQIQRYLLDELEAHERWQFEERYFRDDDDFELLCAIEDELLAAFIDRRLSQGQERRFHQAYRTAAQRRRVQAISLLRRFARQRRIGAGEFPKIS